ncbi:Angiopoietin-related protein 7, partial [Orchesella cincta]
VYCDMETDGGGWTVIQRRGEPVDPLAGEIRESFTRTWKEYENGFGSFSSDFWLGLSDISALCQLGVQQLRIELTNWAGETRYANYHYFKISNASDLYRINVSGYTGTAGTEIATNYYN